MSFQTYLLDAIPSFWASEYWKGVIQNAIGGTLGSFLAILISYAIYKLSIKQSERARKESEKKDREDTLNYFSGLIKNNLHTSTQQVSHIRSFIEQLTGKSLDYPLMTFIPLFDLKRVSENNSLDKVLWAYSNHFRGNTNIVKQFREIIANCDYLYTEFKYLPDQIEKGQKYDYERKLQIQRIFADSFALVGELLVQHNWTKPVPEIKTLQDIMDAYGSNYTDNFDLQYHSDHFFVPVNDLMVALLEAGRKEPILIQLAQLTRDGKQTFNSIKAHNKILADDLESICVSVENGVKSLEGHSKLLLSEFRS